MRQIKDFDLKDFKDEALGDKASWRSRGKMVDKSHFLESSLLLGAHSSLERCLVIANKAFVLAAHFGAIKFCAVLTWQAHAATL